MIDDFYGWLKYSFLLNLMDRYPLMLPNKGGYVECKIKRLIITSNKKPEDWYSSVQDKTPLLRRIDAKVHFSTFFQQVLGNVTIRS